MCKRILFLTCLCLLLGAVATQALTITLPVARSGHDEREDAPSPCLQETAFQAGLDLPDGNLLAGGNAFGCDSEWAASFEFNLVGMPLQETVLNATLVVTKTGYSDDAQGFFYLGAFAYAPAGEPVAVPRADLTPDTALDVLYPPVADTAMSFDVTATVADLLANGTDQAGFLLAGIYSEAGYEDWISLGGTGSTHPAQLVIEMTGVVTDEPSSWSLIKALYR